MVRVQEDGQYPQHLVGGKQRHAVMPVVRPILRAHLVTRIGKRGGIDRCLFGRRPAAQAVPEGNARTGGESRADGIDLGREDQRVAVGVCKENGAPRLEGQAGDGKDQAQRSGQQLLLGEIGKREAQKLVQGGLDLVVAADLLLDQFPFPQLVGKLPVQQPLRRRFFLQKRLDAFHFLELFHHELCRDIGSPAGGVDLVLQQQIFGRQLFNRHGERLFSFHSSTSTVDVLQGKLRRLFD